MATLIGTTSTTISATQITSPLTYMDTGNGMIEYTGSVFLNNNATVDILTNNSGYARMVGLGYFTGIMTSTSWTFGHFTFQCSRYETSYTNILQSDWGGYSISNYQNPSNVDQNSVRFTNTAGDSGTFYFNFLVQNHVTETSNNLTRIK
jgi:hypothetical protein